jgi:hypothetical protein
MAAAAPVAAAVAAADCPTSTHTITWHDKQYRLTFTLDGKRRGHTQADWAQIAERTTAVWNVLWGKNTSFDPKTGTYFVDKGEWKPHKGKAPATCKLDNTHVAVVAFRTLLRPTDGSKPCVGTPLKAKKSAVDSKPRSLCQKVKAFVKKIFSSCHKTQNDDADRRSTGSSDDADDSGSEEGDDNASSIQGD